MKQAMAFFFCCLILAGIYSCQKPQTPKNFILIVDMSGSVDTTLTRWYQKTIRELILPNMEPKDKLIVIPLDRSSQTDNKEIYKIDFSRLDFSSEYAGLDENEIAKKRLQDSISATAMRFNTAFEQACRDRAPYSDGTDIFGSLKQLPKYIEPGRKNYIGLLSDMQNNTAQWSLKFQKSANSDSLIEHSLGTATKVDLNGADVFVLTGSQSAMTSEEYDFYKAFWTKYFTKCNSRLIEYTSGALSPLEHLLQNN